MLVYYDYQRGRTRLKRRYVWAVWSFLAGTVFGLLLAAHQAALAVH